MDGTSLPLRHWVLAMHLLRSGITLADFTRTLGIGPKAARRLERKIRAAWSLRQEQGEEASEAGQGSQEHSGRSGAAHARRPRGRPPKVLERINATPRMIARALFRSR